VAAKDAARNALIVVQDQAHPLLMSDGFEVEEMRWLIPEAPAECAVKTRYRQADLPCRIERTSADRWRVTLREPARAVTPGQYAVFYRDELCLGGGVIGERRNSHAATARTAPPPARREFTYNSSFSLEGS
jgi:tRNA-specific 2-thiouridylase